MFHQIQHAAKSASSILRKPKKIVSKAAKVAGKLTQVNTVQPDHQIEVYHGLRDNIAVITCQENVSGMFASTDEIRFAIPKSSFEKLKHMTLRIDITTATDTVVLAPMPFWFKRIRYQLDNGTGDYISEQYGDNLYFNLCALVDQHQKSLIHNNAGISDNYGERYQLKAGVTRSFYLPLMKSWFDHADWVNKFAKNDILMLLEPVNGIISSGNGTITVSSVKLVCEYESLDHANDLKEHIELNNNLFHTNRFLVGKQLRKTSQTLTAGTTNSISLAGLKGNCAFLQVCIRATSPSNTYANAYHRYIDLGDEIGTSWIDIVDSSNNSILGTTGGRSGQLLRGLEWYHHFSSDFASKKPVYVIAFCREIAEAFDGTVDGYLTLTGQDDHHIIIRPAAAGTQERHTITQAGGAISAGTYRLKFGADITSPLAYNTSAANIQAALDALPSLKNHKSGSIVTTTASAAASAGAAFTIDFSPAMDMEGERVEMLLGVDAATATSATTAITVAGNRGFTTGSYDVTFYAYCFKEIHENKGQFAVSEVLTS